MKAPEERQNRVRRGRGGERKKKREQQEQQEEEDVEEASDTVTVSRSEWEELFEMKTVMKDVVERLSVCERVLKRDATSEEGRISATKKIRLPTKRYVL